MTSNQLTATVKINTTQAERALDRLNKKINNINKVVNSANRGGSANRPVQKVNLINRALTQVRQKINSIMSSSSRLGSTWNRASTIAGKIGTKLTQWKTNLSSAVSAVRHFNSALTSAKGLTSSIWNTLKGMAATYLGIMGTRTAVETSDTITSAQNRLNHLNAQQMGNDAYAVDGSYSPKVLNMTQETMDKMYQSAQKVRMSYTDMMSNVSKTMTLAGDAFQGNIDNAIRFQEIMAESYTLGGASAAEISSSMYQLTQALGAGILAGDELRSVREGAPLAYQAIEKFAQGVYNTTDSLKDMGSEGKITSDMVVAAIMNMGEEADKAFAQTHMLFSQAWTKITNAAKKAFEPVSNMLRDMLNKAMNSSMIEKFEVAFSNIAKALMITLKAISNAISWIAENWSWLEGIIVSGLTTIGVLMVATAIKSALAWVIAHWQLILLASAIFAIIYLVYQWQDSVVGTTKVIAIILGALFAFVLFNIIKMIVASIVLTGTITMGASLIALIVIGVILLIATLFFAFTEQVCGYTWVAVTFIGNLIQSLGNFIAIIVMGILLTIGSVVAFIGNLIFGGVNAIAAIIQNLIAFIVNLVMGCANAVIAISHNAVAGIINVTMGLCNSIQAIATNIGIAFQNAWIWAKNSFWEFIADVLSGVSKLEPVINGIAKLIGKDGVDFGSAISSARSHKSEYKSFVSVGNGWSSGMNTISYKNIGDSWSKGWNTTDYTSVGDAWSKGWNYFDYPDWNKIDDAATFFGTGLEDWSSSKAYDTGANWGANLKNKINSWGSGKANQLKDYIGDKLNLNNISKSLGLDLTDIPGINGLGGTSGGRTTPRGNVIGGNGSGTGGSYDPKKVLDNIQNNLGGIGDDTGSIADSVDLSEEDLSYLREVANMEWKKEFTTATIQVDMSNYNTVNGDGDLDGIVTRLADKLYEELDMVANGVYAY